MFLDQFLIEYSTASVHVAMHSRGSCKNKICYSCIITALLVVNTCKKHSIKNLGDNLHVFVNVIVLGIRSALVTISVFDKFVIYFL